MSIEDLIKRIKLISMGVSSVYLHGGEPFIQDRKDLYALVLKLCQDGFTRLMVETPGTVPLRPMFFLRKKYSLPVGIMVNVRLASTGMAELCLVENFKWLNQSDVLNFICGDEKDFFEAVALLRSMKWFRTKPVIQFQAVKPRQSAGLRGRVLRLDNPILQDFDIRMVV